MWAVSHHKKAQAEQSMHWSNITTVLGEITQVVNRIKSLTVSCGSRLMLIFFSSGRCFSCCLLGAGKACSETVGFPTGCSFFDREHDLRKIFIRHHTTTNFPGVKQQPITCLTQQIDLPLRWRSLNDCVYDRQS